MLTGGGKTLTLKTLSAALLLSAALAWPGATAQASSDEVTIDGVTYTVGSTATDADGHRSATIYPQTPADGKLNVQKTVVHDGVTYNVGLGEGSWGNEHLTEVTLGEGITSVPDRFFDGMREVTKLVVKDDVSGNRGLDLRSCEKLQELWLPATASVQRWPYSHGSQPGALTKVYVVGTTVPSWSASIPASAMGLLVPDYATTTGQALTFEEGDITYALSGEGKVCVTAISSTATTATIPSQVAHGGTTYTVASISSLSSSTLTSLTLQASLESVGSISLASNGSVKIVGEALPSWVDKIDDDCDVFLAASATAQPALKRFLGDDKCLYEVLADNKLRLADMSGLLRPSLPSDAPITLTLPETVTHSGTTYTLTELAARNERYYDSKVEKVVVPASVTTVGRGALAFPDNRGDDDNELTVVVQATTPLDPSALRGGSGRERTVKLNIVGAAWPDWVNNFTSDSYSQNITLTLLSTGEATAGETLNLDELEFTEDKITYTKLYPLTGKRVKMTGIASLGDASEVVFVPATRVTHGGVEYSIAEVTACGPNKPVRIVGAAWPEWLGERRLGSSLSLAATKEATEGESKYFRGTDDWLEYTVTAQATSSANGKVSTGDFSVRHNYVWPATVRFFGRNYDMEELEALRVYNADDKYEGKVSIYTVPGSIKRISGAISGMETLILPVGTELVPGEYTRYSMSKIVVPGATEAQLTALRTLVNAHKRSGAEDIEVVGTLETEFTEGAVTYKKLEPLTEKKVEITYLTPATATEAVYVPTAEVEHGGETYTVTGNGVEGMIPNEVRLVGSAWPSWVTTEKVLSTTALCLAASTTATEGQAKYFSEQVDDDVTLLYTVTKQAQGSANGAVAGSSGRRGLPYNFQIPATVTFFGRSYDVTEFRNLWASGYNNTYTYSVPPSIKRITGDISGMETLILPVGTELVPDEETEYGMSTIVVPGATAAQLAALRTLVNAHKDPRYSRDIEVVATAENMFEEGGVMYTKQEPAAEKNVKLTHLSPSTSTEVVYVPTVEVTHDGVTYTVSGNSVTSPVSNEVRLIGAEWPAWLSSGKELSSTRLTLAATKDAAEGEAKYFAAGGVEYTVTTAATSSANGKVSAQGQNGLLSSTVTLPSTATCFGRTYDVEVLNGLNLSWPSGTTDKTYTVPASIKSITGSITGVERLVLAPGTQLQPTDNDRYDIKSVVVPGASEAELAALRGVVNAYKRGAAAIAVERTLSLPALEAQHAPARPDGIYSLSGERLAQPTRGLCIVVENGQAKLRLYK